MYPDLLHQKQETFVILEVTRSENFIVAKQFGCRSGAKYLCERFVIVETGLRMDLECYELNLFGLEVVRDLLFLWCICRCLQNSPFCSSVVKKLEDKTTHHHKPNFKTHILEA